MKNIQNKLCYALTVLLFLSLAVPHLGYSQEGLPTELSYEVHRFYPSFFITKEKLKEAETLVDLNRYYKSSWVREYISVEVLTTYQGKESKAVSKNDTLTQEQKNFIDRVDPGTDILVKVLYLPENNLTHNEPKENNFSFKVDPESGASYVGGQQQLNQYLQEKVIDRIPEGVFKQYQLAAVEFTVSEEGAIINPHLSWPSKDKTIDALLLKAISNMPCWEPAEYANGLKVKQEFVLMVGDKESCAINLLNIQQMKIEQ